MFAYKRQRYMYVLPANNDHFKGDYCCIHGDPLPSPSTLAISKSALGGSCVFLYVGRCGMGGGRKSVFVCMFRGGSCVA